MKYDEKNLPIWRECEKVKLKKSKPTALQKFIYENEPASEDSCRKFRLGLIDVLNEVSELQK